MHTCRPWGDRVARAAAHAQIAAAPSGSPVGPQCATKWMSGCADSGRESATVQLAQCGRSSSGRASQGSHHLEPDNWGRTERSWCGSVKKSRNQWS